MGSARLGAADRLRRRSAAAAAAAALVIGAPVLAAPPAQQPSACGRDETVVFECPSRGKRIAVCASAGWTADAGSIAYRFGPPGRPEITLPARPAAPRETVSVGVLGFSGGGADYASFETEGHVYTVYSAVSSRWGLKSGVAVDRAGERVSVRRCDRGQEGEFPAGFTTRPDLPRADERFVLPP